MFTRHISHRLAAYIDGERAHPRSLQAEIHLERCARCRFECDQVRLGMASLDYLPTVAPPDAVWAVIEAAFQERRSRPAMVVLRWRLAFAAASVLALIGAAYWIVARQPDTRWEVVRLGLRPVVDHIAAGEWIETDSGSTATLKVGLIGSVEVAPNTRLRVVTARPDEHRLTLARGEIRAKISAPPRLFFVDTASGTAVDLGCEYTLNTDEDGSGLLRVTKGWVAFEWKGLESLVPAGAMCRTEPHVGPGIPYFEDAPESLQQALEGFGYEKTGNDSLSVLLAASRVRDTLTLWHLLWRVEVADRARIYDRIAALTPVPAGVSRERALRLDPETLNRWKEELAWTW
jgi:predicted anti-sigma-YlaC factor YlaD